MTSPHPALGIDYGEARIGIAATDPVGIMAQIGRASCGERV